MENNNDKGISRIESTIGRIQDALGGHSLTPSQPEADLDIIMRIKAIREERDALRRENDMMSQLLHRLSSLDNTDPFDGAHALIEARALLHERRGRLAKESEASE